ncbi:salivary peroxidase/catechol oxidase-like [Dermacentor albipictus]|uniref:salivary peroxidase/catechol oxidase-like n=1 Tax=Dermacentor albipictus TaxID=60249 RepID=UPI0031FCF12C
MRIVHLFVLIALLLLADPSLAQRGRGEGRGRGRGRGRGESRGRGQFRGRGRGRGQGPQNGDQNDSEELQSSACQTGTGLEGVCQPLSRCVYQFNGIDEIAASRCGRGNKVCCPVETPPAVEQSPVRRPANVAGRRVVSLPDISQEDLDIAGRASLSIVRGIDDAERALLNDGIFAKRKSTASQHAAFFGFKLIVQSLGRDGLIGLEATRELARRFNLDSLQGRDGLQRFNIQNTVIADACPKIPRCPSTKFRSADGLCNNLQNREWGKSLSAYERFMPPSYADGITLPRVSIDGGPLPSARKVSVTLAPDVDVPNPLHTLMLMQFGQFIDHDLTLTGGTRFSNGSAITCCDPQLVANPTRRHFACMQIDLSPDDRFYGQFQQNCLEFVRSVAAPRPKCAFGPREQLNQLTAYLDGSAIYGATDEEAKALRSMTDGRLSSTVFSSDEMLPLQPEGVQACIGDGACFRGGDTRVNEQVGLTAMHTLWMREHNRVAAELKRLNPGWKDEILYQEARRIIAAEFQHITYNEYLPLLLGRQIMKEFDLLLTPRGYSNSYDPELNAGIGNVFAAASYRYGHSLVQGHIDLINEDGSVHKRLPLATQFFNPAELTEPGNIDRFYRGLITQPSQSYDGFMSEQLTNHLFEPPGFPFGTDLAALNVQRGRDHGLPSYNDWREFCGLSRIEDFSQLADVMSPQAAQAFAQVYRFPDDIDLFIAGINERPVTGGALGPTFACTIAEQFRRMKNGDRFWYENGGLESSLNEVQIEEIRKASLARIICDNSNVGFVQPLVMIRESSWNPKVDCNGEDIPRVDFDNWQNEPVWT